MFQRIKVKHREFHHHSLLSPSCFYISFKTKKVTFFFNNNLKGPLLRKERNMVPNRLDFFFFLFIKNDFWIFQKSYFISLFWEILSQNSCMRLLFFFSLMCTLKITIISINRFARISDMVCVYHSVLVFYIANNIHFLLLKYLKTNDSVSFFSLRESEYETETCYLCRVLKSVLTLIVMQSQSEVKVSDFVFKKSDISEK